MKMKHMNLLTAALALFTLAACTAQDENENPNGRTALQVTTAAITTRATDNAWEASDAIGITLLEAGTATPVDGKNACKYITATATGNFSPADKENTAYFPTQGKSADVFAYYPYHAIGSELLIPVSTASQAKLSQIDLMTAPPAKGHSAVNPEVALNFRHRLSKLTITVDKEASAGDVDLAGATIKVVGTATTAQWSLTSEKLTTEGNIADIAVPATTTKNGLKATAIVLPTAAGKNVKLIVTTKDGQRSYTAPLDAATALMAGTEHFLNVHLKHTQATVSVTIADWTTGKTLDLPSLVIETTATDGTTEGIHTLTLWSNANATAKADYTFDAATSKWSSPAPFYLENLTEADAFFARHTPTATDAVSALTDVLGNTVAATQKDGGIALELKHLMSKLTVQIARGTHFPEAVDLSGATLTLNGFKKTFDLSDSNVATATGAAAAYTTAIESASLIVVPQTIAVGTQFTATLKNGTTYTATADKAIVLDAAKKQILKLTLSPTETKIALTVTDWAVGETTDLQALNIATTATDGTAANIHTLTLWSNANATAKADYTFDAATSKWSSPAPFYLENLTEADAFFARHTPTATDAVSALADVLGNTAAATQKDGGIALELKHLMSKFNVSLTRGTHFPEATDLAGATLTLNGFKKTFELSDANLATATGTAAAYTATADASGAASLTVIPQTLATGTKFTATLKNGATYTATLAAALTLEAGKIHTLTLTLNPTETKIALTLAEWTTGSNDKQTIIVDGITADGSGISLSATEGDQLTLSTEIGTTAVSATYAYSTATAAWSTAAPLYWDNFAQGKNYAFNALFTPATAPVGANEVDYRHGSATTAFGAPIAFALTHALSAVKMTLQTGTGFTDLKGATIALQSILPLASIANDGTTTLGTTTANPAMNIVTDGKEYALIIAPQTFAAGSTLAVITLGGHTYSVKIPAGTTLHAAAGKIASLDITLTKKEVGQITITLPPWTEGDKLTSDAEYED